MKYLILTVAICLSCFSWSASKTISVKQLNEAISSTDMVFDSTIVDVRTPDEFARGHVPGAINIPHKEIGKHLTKLSALEKDGLILYCRSGKRAARAIQTLSEAGFNNVVHMQGDMTAWLSAKLPVQLP